MRRIGILTAGGDTPALNATLYGAVEHANARHIEVLGILEGFSGLLDPRVPHVPLNPLFSTIPELDPSLGGTLLGASRTYVCPGETATIKAVLGRLGKLGIEGIVCIGGDGTISGMQAIAEGIPCVLAPKTIDNDLGLNYLDEPNDWIREEVAGRKSATYRRRITRDEISLDEMVNYATAGYATAVFVAVQSIQRIRTTAEGHRRIAIIEVMGRQSGFIALGSAYGQPDIILIPEVALDAAHVVERVVELYEQQKHAVIVCGEGIVDESGHQLGAISKSVDPAGNIIFSGAAEQLQAILLKSIGADYFKKRRPHESPESAIFTRKIGHTQRGGRPIRFDRFYAGELGAKAVELLATGNNNVMATLQWSQQDGFTLDSLPANKLRDHHGQIHPRLVHPSFYDARRFRPSKLGVQYLLPIFSNAIGTDDMECMRAGMFSPGNLVTRYQSVNTDIQKKTRYLDVE